MKNYFLKICLISLATSLPMTSMASKAKCRTSVGRPESILLISKGLVDSKSANGLVQVIKTDGQFLAASSGWIASTLWDAAINNRPTIIVNSLPASPQMLKRIRSFLQGEEIKNSRALQVIDPTTLMDLAVSAYKLDYRNDAISDTSSFFDNLSSGPSPKYHPSGPNPYISHPTLPPWRGD